jgi:CheY-like chemotaxis protein
LPIRDGTEVTPSEIRILAVDDDEMMLETLADLFRSFKFDVSVAASGNKAWNLFHEKPFDLIVSDIRMPDGDGIELAKKVKLHYKNKTSILFISGFSESMNEEIYHLGVEGIFAKPFEMQTVKNAIRTCFLAPEVKWANTLDVGKTLLIEKQAKQIVDLESKGDVLFGRRGFFVSHEFAMPPKGSYIRFKIGATEESILFEGVGVVKWVQGSPRGTIPAGIGIEIVSMPTAASLIYRKRYDDLIPFIPSPKMMQAEKKGAS